MKVDRLTQRLAEVFSDRQLFLVGGCLRDQLLGREISDLDLATDALPEEIRRRVEPWADAVWLVGEKFGTVGLEKDGTKAEVTTFRSEAYDGVSRKPEVVFGTDILADLSRRDFTINALARDLHTGELLDPFGGQQDLAAGRVCFLREPSARIAEDPLRMLRAVRFCAQLGFQLDAEARALIAESAGQLARVSWERIRDELDGILLSPHPGEGLRLLIDIGLAQRVLPELLELRLPEPGRRHLKDVLEHTLDTVALIRADKVLRYAALLHDIAKPETFSRDQEGVHFYRHEEIGAERAREILGRLRHPSAFIEQVALLLRNHLRIPQYRSEWSESAVRRLMFDLGAELEGAITLAEADVQASDPRDYEEFERRLDELRARVRQVGEAAELARIKPLLNGGEVMALLGIGPGPLVGKALRFLLDEQIDGRITTREEATEAMRRRFGGGSEQSGD
jgi:poly(A) polymerase